MAPTLTDAVSKARHAAARLLPMLERWVRQNSYSAERDNVNRMGALLAEDFALSGLTLSRQPGQKTGDHLLFQTPAWSARPSDGVLLVGHHDTVFPPGAFEVWRRDGDRLCGPGTLDMKGGLALVHAALSTLSSFGLLAELPLAFVSVADEEIGSSESRDWTGELGRGRRAVLVFEAGRAGDAIVTQRKGTGSFKVVASGKAAHAGNQHKEGVNAIRALARFIDRVEGLTDYAVGTTVNVGLVRGGEAKNTVPAHAECEIDFRIEEQPAGAALVERVHALAAEVGAETRANLTVSGGIRRPPWRRNPACVKLYEQYAGCARAAGLGHGEAGLMGGGSDANHIAATGTPAIDGLGPRGKGFHTHDEYIEVSSLEPKADALVRFLWQACGLPV